MLIPNSQSVSPPAFPLVIVNSFSNSVSLFLILSEVSQTQKDKYHMIFLIKGILKNDTNDFIYKIEAF